MANFDLIFQGTNYTIPKKFILEFLVFRRDLLDATNYTVQSSVPTDIFESFVDSLKSQAKLTVTKENVGSLSKLADEFGLSDLRTQCAAFRPDAVLDLSDQVSELTERVSTLQSHFGHFEEESVSREREVETLSGLEDKLEKRQSGTDSRVQSLEQRVLEMEALVQTLARENVGLREQLDQLAERVRSLTNPRLDSASSPPPKASNATECVMTRRNSLDGIISVLTRKHGGNVHERGIVVITSKSCYSGDLTNVADLRSHDGFISRRGAGQWICWAFHGIQVQPTSYAMRTKGLKAWVLEGSQDGISWQGMDHRADVLDFLSGWRTGSFDIAVPAVCRFIRLTQADAHFAIDDSLAMSAFDVFGTFWED
jgi:uncharacterized coiled-coil protein SlyX